MMNNLVLEKTTQLLMQLITQLRPEGGVRASKNRKNYYSLNRFIF